jgi:hypothetical protein
MRLAMNNTIVKTFHLSKLLNFLGFHSNRFGAFNKLFKSNCKLLVPDRFILEKDEVLQITPTHREFHVLSGIAWITVAGEDIIVNSGEKASLVSNKESAVISALGNVPLTLEVL